jgi:hypothetical protein
VEFWKNRIIAGTSTYKTKASQSYQTQLCEKKEANKGQIKDFRKN